jgi:hypothetical protein
MCVLVLWIIINLNFFYLLLGNNQCEVGVVATIDNLVATSNIGLEKKINDKMEMTFNPSDVKEVEQTKDIVQDISQ